MENKEKSNMKYLVIELYEFDDEHYYSVVNSMFNSKEEAKRGIKEELDKLADTILDMCGEVLHINQEGNVGMTDSGQAYKYFIAEINLDDNA